MEVNDDEDEDGEDEQVVEEEEEEDEPFLETQRVALMREGIRGTIERH